jgi:hypothetical protein
MNLIVAAGSIATALLASNALGWNPLSSSTTEAIMLAVWGGTLLTIGRRVKVREARVEPRTVPVKAVTPRLHPNSAVQARA